MAMAGPAWRTGTADRKSSYKPMRRPPMALELAAAYSVEHGYRIEGMISAAVAGAVISLSRTLQFAREIEGSTSAAAVP